jgi:PAS domain S-box-containing protein
VIAHNKRKPWFKPAPADVPLKDGERLVSLVRLGIACIALPIVVAYFGSTSEAVWTPLFLSGTGIVVWAAMSAVYIYVISKGWYRPWLSFASTACDILFVTLIQIAFISVLPLNFVNGPITTLYFVMIGLAALRKSRRLVLFAGFASAAVHLALTSICFHLYLPSGYLFAFLGHTPIEITFLDEFAIAVCLAVVGWIIGHVTRELRMSERHYHDLFEHVPDGIAVVSKDTTILAVNGRFAEMTGDPALPVVGRKISDFLCVDAGAQRPSYAPGELLGSPTSLRRTDGTSTPVRTVAMPIEYQGAEAFAMSVRDVADQVHLERQLAQSQKMETIGRLAGGLAHDFNNILGSIIGSASLAERLVGRLEPGQTREKLAQQLAVVQECGENARVVVKRLLTFSRTSNIETAPLDLNALVRDVANICRNTFGGGVDIAIAGTDAPLVVRGDATSLTQALLNLCINARDAMSSRGTLTIRVREVDPFDAALERHPSADPEEEYCCIEVEDTGVGMDEAVLEKIFDPFFTTKPPGEGTGLGLSMVYNIARQHGGFVAATSELGRGSRFEMFLTRARTSLLPPEPEDPRMPRGTGRVLVVDDDEMLRSTIRGMLSELGYEVVCCSDGLSALERMGAPDARFDVVLLDVVMPEMDGVRTLELMRERGVRVPVVITSGYMDGASAASLDRHGVAGYLRKPFTFMSLAQTVHATLRRAEKKDGPAGRT